MRWAPRQMPVCLIQVPTASKAGSAIVRPNKALCAQQKGTKAMTMKDNQRVFRFITTCSALVMLGVASEAHAQAMPWENPLRQLLASLQGPTAQAIIIGAIVIAGLALCVGEAGSFFRRAMAATFGGAVAIGASTWAPVLFGW